MHQYFNNQKMHFISCCCYRINTSLKRYHIPMGINPFNQTSVETGTSLFTCPFYAKFPYCVKNFLTVVIIFPTDKTNQSRHDRTPSHSPSISPHPKRILWTLPTKLITNPRLHQISSPVGMVPFNPQSPLNKTPPKMQSISSLSPVVSASPKNSQAGI